MEDSVAAQETSFGRMEYIQSSVEPVVTNTNPRIKIIGLLFDGAHGNPLDPFGPGSHPAKSGFQAGSCSYAGKSGVSTKKNAIKVEIERMHFASRLAWKMQSSATQV